MSNIFTYLVRKTNGELPLNTGAGALVGAVQSQGLNLDATGKIYAILNSQINHYANGLPFNLHGRLVISNTLAPPAYFDQGIPFAANGAVVVAGVSDHISQGIAYSDISSLVQRVTAPLGGSFSPSFSDSFSGGLNP